MYLIDKILNSKRNKSLYTVGAIVLDYKKTLKLIIKINIVKCAFQIVKLLFHLIKY